MSSIQNVDSAPDYIMKFIHGNMEQLCKIYDEGLINNPHLDKGIMVFQCSQESNKMDVQFMNDESMLQVVQKESWEQFHSDFQNIHIDFQLHHIHVFYELVNLIL